MSANTNPIFGLTPNVGFSGVVTTANTNYDGTGTVSTIYTAGANGGIVNTIYAMAQGTNIASMARFFINNGATQATATNNVHLIDLTLPASTASATAAQTQLSIALGGIQLPAGYKIMCCIGTTVAAGWEFSCAGIDY